MIAKHLFDCPLDDETGLCGFTPVLLVTLGANRTGLGNRVLRCHIVSSSGRVIYPDPVQDFKVNLGASTFYQ